MDITHEMIQLPNTEEAFVMRGVDSGSIFFNSKSLDSATTKPWKLKTTHPKGKPRFTLPGRVFNTFPTLA